MEVVRYAAPIVNGYMTRRSLNLVSSRTATRWGAWLAFIVLCVIVGYLTVGFARMALREYEINQAIAKQTALNDAQREQNEQLKAEAEYRESDAYAELAAREQLGMAREGETVLLPKMITPPLALPSPEGDAPAQAETPDTPPDPNYQRWWHALFPPSNATQ